MWFTSWLKTTTTRTKEVTDGGGQLGRARAVLQPTQGRDSSSPTVTGGRGAAAEPDSLEEPPGEARGLRSHGRSGAGRPQDNPRLSDPGRQSRRHPPPPTRERQRPGAERRHRGAQCAERRAEPAASAAVCSLVRGNGGGGGAPRAPVRTHSQLRTSDDERDPGGKRWKGSGRHKTGRQKPRTGAGDKGGPLLNTHSFRSARCKSSGNGWS